MTKRKPEIDPTSVTAAGGVALLASVLANLKQYGDNEQLQHTVQALQRLVQDWQVAYNGLNAQLNLALRTNDDQNRMIAALREENERVKVRAYDAEQRALEAEARAIAAKQKVSSDAPPASE